MIPALTYLQSRFPQDVLVVMVDSRDCLIYHDHDNLVEINGRTDFMLLDRQMAYHLLGEDFNVEQQPEIQQIDSLMAYAVLGLVELKPPRKTRGKVTVGGCL